MHCNALVRAHTHLFYISAYTSSNVCGFYVRELARISYGNSVRLSVCPSRPGTVPRPGEIETSGFNPVIA